LTEERFKILFRGDIAEGHRRDEVRDKLVETFGLKVETVETLLDGQTATLKKNLDREGALKFKQAFENTGAICYIRPMDDSMATSAPKPPSRPVSEPAPPVSSPRSEPQAFTVVDSATAESEPEPTLDIPAGPTPGTMTCPKCGFVQPSADFCQACGVVILKFLKRQWEEEQLARQVEEAQRAPEEPPAETPAPSQPPPPRPHPAPQPAPPPQEPGPSARSEPESFTVVDSAAAEPEPEPSFDIPTGPTPGTMSCPKCGFVQPSADFCEACGVVILKFLKRQWEEEQLARQVEEAQRASEEPPAETPAPPQPPPPRPHPTPQPAPPPQETGPSDRSEPESFTVVDSAATEPAPTFDIPAGPTPGTMSCPKCGFVQPRGDFCAACGVVVLKYLQRQAAEREQQATSQSGEDDGDKEADLEQLRAIFDTPTVPPPSAAALPQLGKPVPEPFKNICRRASSRLRDRAPVLFGLWTICLAFFLVSSRLELTLSAWTGPSLAALGTALLRVLVISLTFNAALHVLSDPFLTFRPALAIALQRLASFVWLHAWLAVVLIGTSLCLLVPGFLCFRRYALASFCFSREQTRGLTCLLRSRAYTREREETFGRLQWPGFLLLILALAGLVWLPISSAPLALLPLLPMLSLLSELHQDAVETRPALSYDDTLVQRIQVPAFGIAGLLVFTIALVLVFGPGRIRAGLQTVLFDTGLFRPTAPPVSGSQDTSPPRSLDQGVFEIEVNGYQVDVYLNGEPIIESLQGATSRRKSSAPVSLKPGRNVLALSYTALADVGEREMVFKVFRWNFATLTDENFGQWRIDDTSGLRRYEFTVTGVGGGE